MKRCFLTILPLFLLLLFFVPLPPVYAQGAPLFTFSLDGADAAPGGLVTLRVTAEPNADPAAAFSLRAAYDETALSFVRAESSSGIKSGTLETNGEANPVYSVYVCNVDKGAAPALSGNIVSLVFRVRDATPPGAGGIDVKMDQICNFRAEQLPLVYEDLLSYTVSAPEQPLSGRAFLTALEPSAGKLEPAFSPDVHDYDLKVDSAVTAVTFSAAAGEGGSARISRRTLGKAGTDTLILAAVTSADRKAKAEYRVTVHRAAAAGEPDGSAPSRGGASSKKTDAPKAAVSRKSASSGAGSSPGATVRFVPYGAAGSASGGAPASAQTTEAAAPAAAGQNVQPVKALYVAGSQMPAYVTGMLAAAVCLMLGIAASFWLKIRPGK